MIRLFWRTAMMALWVVVTAGFALKLPTFVAVEPAAVATTASSQQHQGTFSSVVSSSKDDIALKLPKLRIDEPHRIWSQPWLLAATTAATTVELPPNEKIIPTPESSSFARTDECCDRKSSLATVVNRASQAATSTTVSLRPILKSTLNEKLLASPSLGSKPVASSIPSVSSAIDLLFAERRKIVQPSSSWSLPDFYAPAMTVPYRASEKVSELETSTKNSLITDALPEPGNYASEKANLAVTSITTTTGSTGEKWIEQTIGYSENSLATEDTRAENSNLMALDVKEAKEEQANLTVEASSAVNEFIEASRKEELGSTTVPEQSALFESMKITRAHGAKEKNALAVNAERGGLRTTDYYRTNEMEGDKASPSTQGGSWTRIPLIMTVDSSELSAKRLEMVRGAEAGNYDCVSNCLDGSERLNKARIEDKEELGTAFSTPPLFTLITKDSLHLSAKRERRLSFNASSSPLPTEELRSTIHKKAVTTKSPLTILSSKADWLDIGFSTARPHKRSDDLSIGRQQLQQLRRAQQQPGQNTGGGHNNKENSTKVIAPIDQWPVKHSAVVEGDLILGALMMVHEREDTVTCGPVMPQGGIQALEAMLYTLDRLNEQEIVPGVKVGAHILDDCDKDTYGLEMAVDFIKEDY